jgi:hypothetical protein
VRNSSYPRSINDCSSFFASSPSGRSTRIWPDRFVVPTPSTLTPILPSVPSNVGMAPKMPIDPVIVDGCAQISSAEAAM